MIDWLIWLNIAWIIGHELDAVQQHEWRFFAQPFSVDDAVAYRVFTVLHVPLMVWMLWAMPSQSFRIGFSLFMMSHALVHYLLRNHPLITFNHPISQIMIYAPVPTSIAYLFLVYTGG